MDQVTLIECVRFRGRERRINISQEIGTKYITFGTLLLEERTGERVSAIARDHKHMHNSEQTSMEILEEWIAGRGKQPVTWNTLIEVLHDIELSSLAREIAAVKPPAEVTEDHIDSDQRKKKGTPTGSIQVFSHDNSEEEVTITENLLTNNFQAMLVECKDSDVYSEGSRWELAHDTEVLDFQNQNKMINQAMLPTRMTTQATSSLKKVSASNAVANTHHS